MSSTVPRYETGPLSYLVNSAVDGGQLVQIRTDDKIEVATADSAKCRGVALYPAAPEGTTGGASTTFGGNDVFDYSSLQPDVAVQRTGMARLKASATINNGDMVKCGANGTVVPLGASAATLIVAECHNPGGVANGQYGDFWLKLA